MRLTNLSALPEPVVRLVDGPERLYEPGRISVTTLLRPPQMVALEREHWDEIEEDAADRIWATYGTLIHLALERMGADNALQEETLETTICGWTVHGTPDLYESDGTLTDFKFVSVYTTLDGIKSEWEQQLNCYAYLLAMHGFPVRSAQVVALYRDWSKSRVTDDYPQKQAQKFPVRLWSLDRMRSFLEERVKAHQDAPVPCTAEDRWERPTVWAVTKRGNKRASRLLYSEGEAQAWAEENVPNGNKADRWFEITMRPGANVRCESYCRVAQFCTQYREIRGVTTIGATA